MTKTMRTIYSIKAKGHLVALAYRCQYWLLDGIIYRVSVTGMEYEQTTLTLADFRKPA